MVPDGVPGIPWFDNFFAVTGACERVNQSEKLGVENQVEGLGCPKEPGIALGATGARDDADGRLG